MPNSIATRHSLERAKERHIFKNTQAAQRQINLAFHRGKRAEECNPQEKAYLKDEAYDGCVAVAYNNYCYIFNDRGRCVTLYKLPAWFNKKSQFDGKVKIRDCKQYWKNVRTCED